MSEVADAFNVSTRTLFNWLNLHPELHDAVQVGVDAFNARVERALAERAIGFFVTIKEEVRDEQGKVIQPEQRQYYPPMSRRSSSFSRTDHARSTDHKGEDDQALVEQMTPDKDVRGRDQSDHAVGPNSSEKEELRGSTKN